MAKITDNLKLLSQTKTDIKNAIEQKGQSLENTPFTKYAEKILRISGGGGGTEDLTDVLTEQDNIISALENAFGGFVDDFQANLQYVMQMDTFDNLLSGRTIVDRDYTEQEIARLDSVLKNITQGEVVNG